VCCSGAALLQRVLQCGLWCYEGQCSNSTETRCVPVCVCCSVWCSSAALLQCVLQCGLRRYGGPLLEQYRDKVCCSVCGIDVAVLQCIAL